MTQPTTEELQATQTSLRAVVRLMEEAATVVGTVTPQASEYPVRRDINTIGARAVSADAYIDKLLRERRGIYLDPTPYLIVLGPSSSSRTRYPDPEEGWSFAPRPEYSQNPEDYA